MNKTTIKIICIASMFSSVVHAGEQFDFFRFDSFKSKEDQCRDKTDKLKALNASLLNNKVRPDSRTITLVEHDLELAKANRAIIDGLKRINLEFKNALTSVAPDGNFMWTYNDAKKVDLIQGQTINAAAQFTRFQTMSDLISGIQKSIENEPLNPPASLPRDNMTARSEWLYKELVAREKKTGSMNERIKGYFKEDSIENPSSEKSKIIAEFLKAYSMTLIDNKGGRASESFYKSNLQSYNRALFQAIPIPAQEMIAATDLERFSTAQEYADYKKCLTSSAQISDKKDPCSDLRTVWQSKVSNIKSSFTDIKNELTISTKDLDRYANIDDQKLISLTDSMEKSLPTIANAKEDLINRVRNMQLYKDKKINISHKARGSNASNRLDSYNSVVRQLLCQPGSCASIDDPECRTSDSDKIPKCKNDVINEDLSINQEKLKIYLGGLEAGQISDEKLTEIENKNEADIAAFQGELDEILANSKNKVIMMSMDLLTEDIVQNCREKAEVSIISCSNADLGSFRSINVKIKDLNGNMEDVVTALRGDPKSSTILTINTECTKIVPIEDTEDNKPIKAACADAAKKYMAIETSKKEQIDTQKYFETHKITPNERGQVYVTNEDGKRVLAEGAVEEKVDSGIGRALAQSFYEQMYGDPLLPGWMTIGVNQMNLGNQLEYFDWYGKQEKTYMSWQQQYWGNINQQCAFASGMCVPVSQNPSTGLGFGF